MFLDEFSFSLFLLLLFTFILALFLVRLRNKERSTYYLIGFYFNIFLLFLAGFLGLLFPNRMGDKFILLQYIFAQLALVFLLLFVYHFQGLYREKEAKLVLYISLLLFLLISLHIFKLVFFRDVVEGREIAWIAMVAGMEFLWALVVLARKSLFFYRKGRQDQLSRIKARRTESFAYLMIIPIGLSLLVFFAYLDIIPKQLHNLIFTEGAALFFFLFVLMYLNYSTIPVSLVSKIVGITLVSALILLNLVGVFFVREVQRSYDDLNLEKVKLCREKLLSPSRYDFPPEVKYILRFDRGNLFPQDFEVIYSAPGWNGREFIREDNLLKRKSYDKVNFFSKISRNVKNTLHRNPLYFSYLFPLKGKIYEVGISAFSYRRQIHYLVLKLIAISFLLFLFLIFVFPLFFKNCIIDPVNDLLEAAEEIEGGNLDLKVPVRVMDEFGILSQAFNKMASSLRSSREKILEYSRTLEKKVAERTRDLREKNQMLLKMKKKLEEAAITDPLTGLLNRRGLYQLIDHEISRVRRNNSYFSLVLCDIDDFKKINDTYGHDCGDYVLKTIAEILNVNSREVDKVGRWGGEEFLIVLPETPLEGAVKVAEKIRRAIEEKLFLYGETSLKVTMTFGVSIFSSKTPSLDHCLKEADDALYRGKSLGKNRVVVRS